MAVRQQGPIAVYFDDDAQERVRANFEQRISDLQKSPGATELVLTEVTIPSGGTALVEHSLGRAPTQVRISPPRFDVAVVPTAGAVYEITGATDRTRLLKLGAVGFGAATKVTVTVV
jgi:hypothetical protein